MHFQTTALQELFFFASNWPIALPQSLTHRREASEKQGPGSPSWRWGPAEDPAWLQCCWLLKPLQRGGFLTSQGHYFKGTSGNKVRKYAELFVWSRRSQGKKNEGSLHQNCGWRRSSDRRAAFVQRRFTPHSNFFEGGKKKIFNYNCLDYRLQLNQTYLCTLNSKLI